MNKFRERERERERIHLFLSVESIRVHPEYIGRFSEGIKSVSVGVGADLGVVCEVLSE